MQKHQHFGGVSSDFSHRRFHFVRVVAAGDFRIQLHLHALLPRDTRWTREEQYPKQVYPTHKYPFNIGRT